MSTSKQRISNNQPGPFGKSQKDHGIRIHLQRANSAAPRSITDAASAKPGSAAHHDLFSKSKQRSSWQRFQTANIAPPLNVTDPNRRASRHSFEETVQYSSTSGHRFPATVVHMSCSPREVQGCSGGPRGDQGGPGLHFQTQISTLGVLPSSDASSCGRTLCTERMVHLQTHDSASGGEPG